MTSLLDRFPRIGSNLCPNGKHAPKDFSLFQNSIWDYRKLIIHRYFFFSPPLLSSSIFKWRVPSLSDWVFFFFFFIQIARTDSLLRDLRGVHAKDRDTFSCTRYLIHRNASTIDVFLIQSAKKDTVSFSLVIRFP